VADPFAPHYQAQVAQAHRLTLGPDGVGKPGTLKKTKRRNQLLKLLKKKRGKTSYMVFETYKNNIFNNSLNHYPRLPWRGKRE